MFSSAVRGGKAFAAEQKIRELKKRIFWLLALGKSVTIKKRPNIIIRKATDNRNALPTPKYGVSPNMVEKKSLSSDRYKEWFNFRWIRKISKEISRHEKYQRKQYVRKKKQLCVPLQDVFEV